LKLAAHYEFERQASPVWGHLTVDKIPSDPPARRNGFPNLQYRRERAEKWSATNSECRTIRQGESEKKTTRGTISGVRAAPAGGMVWTSGVNPQAARR
jgi:hypothetical protein